MARLNFRSLLATALAVTLLASACTASPGHGSQHSDSNATATLLRVGTSRLGPVTLQIPPGALARGTTLRIEDAPTSYLILPHSFTVARTTVPSPLHWVLRPLYLKLSREPLRPVTLSFHLATHLEEHLVLLTASPGASWHIVRSSYASSTGVLTAHVRTLSLWAVLGFLPSQLTAFLAHLAKPLLGNLDISTEHPTCPRVSGLLAEQTPGPLAWCIKAHHGDSVTVAFRNTARYWISLGIPDGAALMVSSSGSTFAALGAHLSALELTLLSHTKHRYVAIPAGQTGTLVLSVPPGSQQTFGDTVNLEAIFSQMLAVGLELIGELDTLDSAVPSPDSPDSLPPPSQATSGDAALPQVPSIGTALGVTACLNSIRSLVGPRLIPSRSALLSTLESALTPCLTAALAPLPQSLVVSFLVGLTVAQLVAEILQILVASGSYLIALVHDQNVQLMRVRNPIARAPAPASPVPLVTFGAALYGSPSWTGVRPSSISLSGDGGNFVTGIRWTEWGPSEAVGYGISEVESCNPNCAQGSRVSVPTEVILSDVVAGKFTTLTEKRDGAVMTVPTSEVPSATGSSTSGTVSETLSFGDRLSPSGIGPVMIGMTLSQVNAVLPPSDQVHQVAVSGLGAACKSAQSWAGNNYIALDDNPGMIATAGRLAVLSLSAAGGREFTTRGIALGSSLAQLLRAYPTAAPASSSSGYTNYLFNSGQGLGMLFVVGGSPEPGVGGISAGLIPALLDCL